jgi:hypothetical protein
MSKARSKPSAHEQDEDDNSIITRQSKYAKQYGYDLVTFNSPEHPTAKEEMIIADIVSLDHRSVHALKPNTSEREEVKMLLLNAVVTLQANQVLASRSLVKKAETSYYHHLQAKNRLKYLIGMVIGIIVSLLIAYLIEIISSSTSSFVDRGQVMVFCLFAGMGSIASVLTRLSDINLKQETSRFLIMISGGARPVVAIFFAVVVYIILSMKILDIKFGSEQTNPPEVYLITSFLCGFSERFAKDIISRVSLTEKNDDKSDAE